MNEHPAHLSKAQLAVRIRLGRLLYWCTRVDDADLSDTDFVMTVVNRYRANQDLPLIDPAE